MAIEVRVVANADEATVVWQSDSRIGDCRGFALLREGREPSGVTVESILHTSVGFADQKPHPPPGTFRPSTEWPIQRFLWSDYDAERFDQVRDRVVPIIGRAGALQRAPENQQSDWSAWARATTGQTPGLNAYFNRGIVAAQWLRRRLAVPASEERKALKDVISDPTSKIREFLAGQDRVALLALLDEAEASRQQIYAALYELNDPELIPRLKALGERCNLVLANGAFSATTPDENLDASNDLAASEVALHHRLVGSGHFAHNKFVVVCDHEGKPLRVWTGSTNWTVTGLCTQANNALLIDDQTVARAFLDYWNRLLAAGDDYPPELADTDSTPMITNVGSSHVTTWLTPVRKKVDLADARTLINGARQGILFLMFNPGPKETLFDDILARRDAGVFVHGVINQDPGGRQTPKVLLLDRGKELPSDPGVILPANVSEDFGFWEQELRSYSLAMVHSKVIVIDPFGAHPVVMTGSHNMGPKASAKNDDNLVLIENAPGLAGEYAVNVLSIYSQYKWRFNMLPKPSTRSTVKGAKPKQSSARRWQGLRDDDTWQDDFFSGPRVRELDFWFGRLASPPG